MNIAQLPEYIEKVRSARELAAGLPDGKAFPVYMGFECEWFPAYESWYRDYLRGELGAEFLVYGAHWVDYEGEFWYIPELPEKKILARYVDLTVRGLGSGLYDLFAHPDIFLAGFTRMDAEIREACKTIIDAAIAADMPMEINGLGLQKTMVRGDHGMRPPYPVREFWEMAAAAGATIVCNSDAHRPQDVIASTRKAYDFARAAGIEPVDTAEALGFAGSLKKKIAG